MMQRSGQGAAPVMLPGLAARLDGCVALIARVRAIQPAPVDVDVLDGLAQQGALYAAFLTDLAAGRIAGLAAQESALLVAKYCELIESELATGEK